MPDLTAFEIEAILDEARRAMPCRGSRDPSAHRWRDWPLESDDRRKRSYVCGCGMRRDELLRDA